MYKAHPPKYGQKFLKWVISEELYDDIDGDLTEIFHDNVSNLSIGQAKRQYLFSVLSSIRNIHLRRKLKFYNPLVMYKNYFKITLRNILKYKGYSFINIFGLALGMASCLLILLFVNNEKSFDGFHEKKSNIYRLDEVQTFGAMSAQKVALSMYPMGPNLLADYPQIVDFTRYWTLGRTLLNIDNVPHYLEQPVRVDTSFFKIFDFKLIQGDKDKALKESLNILLSETNAKRIFGDEDPMGQVIDIPDYGTQFTVAGIFEDVPDNSHLQFDALVSTLAWDDEDRKNGWGSNYLNTYLELANNVDIDELEGKFDDFLVKFMGEEALDYYKLFLQPLTDVHLGSMKITHDYNNHKKFAKNSVDIFLILAFFVLLIASINFMNLSTARAATRSREVGVRKSVGAFKAQITGQFVMESILLTILALIVAFGLCFGALNTLVNIVDRDLSMMLFFEPYNLALVLLTAILIGLLSGIYPAFVMSKFNPVTALKGNGTTGGNSLFRSILVVFQFAIAITIIIGTSIVTRQLNYMQNLDLGFDKELVVAIDMYQDTNERYDVLKSELMNQSNVAGVTGTSQKLGNNLHQTSTTYELDTARINGSSSFVIVDSNFFDFYDMEIVEGRALSNEFAADGLGRSFVVNESLAKELGADGSEVLGMPFHFGGTDALGAIVGIVKDFNYNKLNLKVEPLFMSHQPWASWTEVNVKIKSGDIQTSLQEIETVWSSLFPERPFEYEFLDDHIDSMYQSEQQLTQVISILSGLSIIIASLGLFGLASFTVRQRLKEMGIRKVLGASVSQIVILLSKKFTILVIIAFVLAAPLTYYLMKGWLDGYTYKIAVGVAVFLIVGIGSWLIALLTVSIQSIRVAKSNPVETLRIE
ncbi:FtsX-like permease family protein [Roseivirga sp.]|uniref:FtsX-like permease family protein n=1 Tax=Roseivirga sp. TaxID=1964215 RepID=UPI003B8B7D65